MTPSLRIFVLVFGLGLSGVAKIHAHEAGLSVVQVQLHADSLELSVSYALADVQRMLPPSVRLGTDTSRAIESAQAELDQLGSLLWEVRAGGEALVPRDLRIDFTPSDNLAFHLVYPRPEAGVVVFRATNLGSLPSTHREHFTCVDEAGRMCVEKMLSARNSAVEVSLLAAGAEPAAPAAGPGREVAPPAFGEFLKLGVAHIWTGYDHLLFLFGLLVVCRTFKSIIGIVTCFTLAHSLTLALATLNVVNLPARLVEPAIAASIVFVGLENILRRGGEPRGRWALTFLFGLVHGFGFATVLRELGVGARGQGLVMPLFAFNLGVEAGQVVVAGLVLPLVWQLRKNETFLRRGVPALSSLVVAAGLYWLVERTLLA